MERTCHHGSNHRARSSSTSIVYSHEWHTRGPPWRSKRVYSKQCSLSYRQNGYITHASGIRCFWISWKDKLVLGKISWGGNLLISCGYASVRHQLYRVHQHELVYGSCSVCSWGMIFSSQGPVFAALQAASSSGDTGSPTASRCRTWTETLKRATSYTGGSYLCK